MLAEDVKVCIPELKNGHALIILSSDLLAMLTATAISTFKDLSFFNSSFICFSIWGLAISRLAVELKSSKYIFQSGFFLYHF